MQPGLVIGRADFWRRGSGLQSKLRFDEVYISHTATLYQFGVSGAGKQWDMAQVKVKWKRARLIFTISQTKPSEQTAFIVPAFETFSAQLSFPRTKADLLRQVNEGGVKPFRFDVWQAGHQATNFSHWYLTDKPYQVRIWVPLGDESLVNALLGFGNYFTFLNEDKIRCYFESLIRWVVVICELQSLCYASVLLYYDIKFWRVDEISKGYNSCTYLTGYICSKLRQID